MAVVNGNALVSIGERGRGEGVVWVIKRDF